MSTWSVSFETVDDGHSEARPWRSDDATSIGIVTESLMTGELTYDYVHVQADPPPMLVTHHHGLTGDWRRDGPPTAA